MQSCGSRSSPNNSKDITKMKIRISFLILATIIIVGCSYTEKKDFYKLHLAELFYTNYPIKVWVNNNLIFKGVFQSGKDSDISNYMLIGHLPKNKKTLIKVSTIYKDTTFCYNTDSIESLYIWIPSKEYKYFEIKDNNTKLREGEPGLD